MWLPFLEQQQEAGEMLSGNWQETALDDFPNGLVGDMGWTSAVSGAAAANTALSTVPTVAAALKMSGGFMMKLGTTTSGQAANELLGHTIAPWMTGIQLDFRVGIDAAFSTATDTFRWNLGIFDAVGAVTTGNFVGLEYGATGAGTGLNWRLAYGTYATPTYLDTGISVGPLDTPQNLRIFLGSNGTTFNYLNAWVNNQVMAPQPVLTGLPAITNGWPAIKALKTAGTANTAQLIVDAFAIAIQGRTTN